MKADDNFVLDSNKQITCDGQYTSYFVESSDASKFGCCAGYVINKASQLCIQDKPLFIGK